MPSLDSARRIASATTNGANTIGQMLKADSDFIMEQTWFSDIQSKICYIYDYFHDDDFSMEKSKYITHENTNKKRIDAKFIISSYGSIDKDQVAYHLMFKPSEKVDFDEDDDMYYYETDYRQKYDTTYPIGLYVDIPDDKGIYVRWLICDFEEANQFVKYTILPCDYRFQWISLEDGVRLKRQVWGCTRVMNSYNSGLWIDRYINTTNDVSKIILPLNSITDKLDYLRENGINQRVILSAKTNKPLTWKMSKVENTKPIGILKLTLSQDTFNPHTDYIEKDENGKIIGMWADYFSSDLSVPVDEPVPLKPTNYVGCNIVCSANNVKVGGTYKTITSNFYNETYEDISDEYKDIERVWNFYIDDILVNKLVDVKYDVNKNIIKIKFKDDKQYIGKSLLIECVTNYYIFGKTTIGIIG